MAKLASDAAGRDRKIGGLRHILTIATGDQDNRDRVPDEQDDSAEH